ncbi:MAG: PAS domain S-box protein [Acidobacteriota bacterium]|nr:PAS domain S-box protein [Acidobacteriota bacterium]
MTGVSLSKVPENRYERLFATAKDGILIVDAASGEILDVNPRGEEMFGYGAESLIGKRISEQQPFSDAGVADRMFSLESEIDAVQFEVELMDGGGDLQPCEFLCNRYSESGREVIQGNVRNVAKRRTGEAHFRHTESQFLMLRDGVKDYAIILLNASGHIVSWNAGAERIFGYSEAEILGQAAQVIFTPEDRRNCQPEQEMQTALARGWAEDDRWHLRKDRTRFLASGVLSALRDEEGQLQGFVKILRDITERQKHEQLLEQARKLETVGMLAGGVAHDFNNLLTSILGNTSLALEELSPFSSLRSLLEPVVHSSERAASLTRQLLAYAGKGRFESRPFELSSLVSQIRVRLEDAMPGNVRLEFGLAPGLPEVEGDPSLIEQVWMNLTLNAGEALEGREGTVRVETGFRSLVQRQIEELGGGEAAPGFYVYGKVIDTGMGMEEKIQAKVFDPFFTTKFLGRGLGLAAVSGILRQHKGMIRVFSRPGEGSTFQFFLPVRREAGSQASIPGVA